MIDSLSQNRDRMKNSGAHGDDALTWQTSSLPPLGTEGVRGLVDIMAAWYHRRTWHLPANNDPDVFWQYADRLGLGGLLGAIAWQGMAADPKIEEYAVHRYLSNQIYHQQALRCCEALQQKALQKKIKLVVVKGPAITMQGYIDPGVRSYSDIDLFTENLKSVVDLSIALGRPISYASFQKSLAGRLAECECVGIRLNNWELEFRYPLDPPGEPMFELLQRWHFRLLTVPATVGQMLTPDPTIHLIYLIQHMAVHHLFSRFLWFLDLAVLMRENGSRVDLDRVEKELDHLGLANVGNIASKFCRRYIDGDFPLFKPKLPAWNYTILARLTQPQDIATGRFGIYHGALGHRIIGYLIGMLSYYIIADPSGGHSPRYGYGTHWTLNRMRVSLGQKKPIPWIEKWGGFILTAVLLPISIVIAKFFAHSHAYED